MADLAPRIRENTAIAFPNGNPHGRILIVDDALIIRASLRAIITEAGHTVVGEASTGREAVSLYHLFRPDIIMMDITMPDRDGLAAMEEILASGSNVCVIICTAIQFKHVATNAIKRGAYDFITKPFRPQSVLQAIDGALGRLDSCIPGG